MWLDLIALALLALFAWMGARRGGLTSALSLVSLFVSYAAAIAAAPRWGPGLAEQLDVPQLVGIPLAGTLGFAAAWLGMALVSTLLRRWEEVRRGGALSRSPRDRFLGGLFGALRGALVVLLVSWLALWLEALRATGAMESLPEVDGSAAATVTGAVVEAGVSAAMADQGSAGRVVARMAARPGASIAEVQAVLEDDLVTELREDAMFWTYLESGAVDSALNRASFVTLTRDYNLRRRLGDLGMIGEAAVADPAEFRAVAREVLREVAPRIRGLKNDPELQALLDDPEVMAMIHSGNAVGLMTHPGFRGLVERVSAEPQ